MIALRGDLRQVGHAQHLAALAERAQLAPDDLGNRAADTRNRPHRTPCSASRAARRRPAPPGTGAPVRRPRRLWTRRAAAGRDWRVTRNSIWSMPCGCGSVVQSRHVDLEAAARHAQQSAYGGDVLGERPSAAAVRLRRASAPARGSVPAPPPAPCAAPPRSPPPAPAPRVPRPAARRAGSSSSGVTRFLRASSSIAASRLSTSCWRWYRGPGSRHNARAPAPPHGSAPPPLPRGRPRARALGRAPRRRAAAEARG